MGRRMIVVLGVLALGLAAGRVEAAMSASYNGAALFTLAGEGGTYTSCSRVGLSTTNDQGALIGMSCSGANKAFTWRFTIPTDENPSTVNIGVSAMGNATGSQNACLSLKCGCGGDTTAELELEDVAYGTASVMTIASAAGWAATESKTTIVNSVALQNGGEDRSCTCLAFRGTAGGCTDNWTGALEVESIEFAW